MVDFARVVVWTENNLLRDCASAFFMNKGIEAKPVLAKEEAFAFASKKNGSLILLGLKPGKDIPLLVAELINLDNQNRVVVFGDNTGVETAVRCVKNGAEDFLVMPSSREDIEHICSLLIKKKKSVKIPDESLTDEPESCNEIIAADQRMKKVIELADKIAPTRAPVLLAGESGTGKEVLARFIHRQSKRTGPFIGVNCAALPETLLESSLFGHEKGAFTGAVSRKPGKFELADKGTLLLDEITEMPVYLQAKLLRVLQEGEIDRLGGTGAVKVDVRVIAATNRNPLESVKNGEFRNDLYHRINTIPLSIPPLRERPDDIKKLSEFFIQKYNKIDNKNVKGLTADAVKKLFNLFFHGNVRELENIIRRGMLICSGDMIDSGDIVTAEEFGESDASHESPAVRDYAFSPKPLREVEKELIFKTLEETEGNRTHAAELLGISVRTLRNKLNLYKENMELP
ncbi:MAG: sigma-54-dependent Fis family transcriptional regulator [Desulfobacteraceae bacterium]|nr:sigma-54-dependent Fis family transcriptional regulator [Desulfobacteraceae bacterium]